MKKKTTRQIIRQIVREEVAMAIKEVITELKQPQQQSTTPIVKESFSKNKVLNDVLNETAGDQQSWETMGGAEYTTERMGEMVGKSYGDMMKDTPQQNVSPSDPMAQFVNKDYREVLKKAAEKQKRGM